MKFCFQEATLKLSYHTAQSKFIFKVIGWGLRFKETDLFENYAHEKTNPLKASRLSGVYIYSSEFKAQQNLRLTLPDNCLREYTIMMAGIASSSFKCVSHSLT